MMSMQRIDELIRAFLRDPSDILDVGPGTVEEEEEEDLEPGDKPEEETESEDEE